MSASANYTRSSLYTEHLQLLTDKISTLSYPSKTRSQIQTHFEELLKVIHLFKRSDITPSPHLCSSCSSLQSSLEGERNMVKVLEKENAFLKRERQKWINLQEEYPQLHSQSEIDFTQLHTTNRQLETQVNSLKDKLKNRPGGTYYQIEHLQMANRHLETKLYELQSEFEHHKQVTQLNKNQLKIDYNALSKAYTELKQNYSDELKNFHAKIDRTHSEKLAAESNLRTLHETSDSSRIMELETKIDALAKNLTHQSQKKQPQFILSAVELGRNTARSSVGSARRNSSAQPSSNISGNRLGRRKKLKKKLSIEKRNDQQPVCETCLKLHKHEWATPCK